MLRKFFCPVSCVPAHKAFPILRIPEICNVIGMKDNGSGSYFFRYAKTLLHPVIRSLINQRIIRKNRYIQKSSVYRAIAGLSVRPQVFFNDPFYRPSSSRRPGEKKSLYSNPSRYCSASPAYSAILFLSGIISNLLLLIFFSFYCFQRINKYISAFSF